MSQGSGPQLLMFAPGGFRSVISRWTAQGGKREWKEMDGLAALSRYFTCIATTGASPASPAAASSR